MQIKYNELGGLIPGDGTSLLRINVDRSYYVQDQRAANDVEKNDKEK